MKRLMHLCVNSLRPVILVITLLPASASAQVGILEDESANDTCPGQDLQCGDLLSGLSTNEIDYINFVANQGDCISISTFHEWGGGNPQNTYLELYNSDCSRLLAWDDDSGLLEFAHITDFRVPETGLYVVAITQYSATAGYRLRITCDTSVQPNATCETSVLLPCGTVNLTGTTACTGNDYTLLAGNSCTGVKAQGQDVVYRINAHPSLELNLDYTSTTDGSIYLVSDCTDPIGTCIAGSDSTFRGETEHLEHTFNDDGTYYLILDSFATDTAGNWTLVGNVLCDTAVLAQHSTWGLLKSRYTEDDQEDN